MKGTVQYSTVYAGWCLFKVSLFHSAAPLCLGFLGKGSSFNDNHSLVKHFDFLFPQDEYVGQTWPCVYCIILPSFFFSLRCPSLSILISNPFLILLFVWTTWLFHTPPISLKKISGWSKDLHGHHFTRTYSCLTTSSKCVAHLVKMS